MKKYYENLDTTYEGMDWHKGLIPAIIAGVFTYVIAHFYGERGAKAGLEVGDYVASELNDTIDNRNKEKKD